MTIQRQNRSRLPILAALLKAKVTTTQNFGCAYSPGTQHGEPKMSKLTNFLYAYTPALRLMQDYICKDLVHSRVICFATEYLKLNSIQQK